MIRALFNVIARFRPYRTEWVEDLPDRIGRDVAYVIGGRRYPFSVAMVCPRRACREVVHLDLSKEVEERWRLKEHARGEISLWPSVHVTGRRCQCHYWLRDGRIVWAEKPCLIVPRENRDD